MPSFEADSRGLARCPTPIKFPLTDLRRLRVTASARKTTVSELVRQYVHDGLQRDADEPETAA